MSLIDEPSSIREGEHLDEARLERYLLSKLPGFSAPLRIRQFPRGHSNLTYLVLSGNEEWVLRRPPFGSQVKGAHDMGREYRILSKLSSVWPKAPRPLLYCDDPDVLGAPFYLMERLSGIILRARPPRGMALDSEMMRDICGSFIDTLADLHRLDRQSAGLSDLGKPEGYNTRQVVGWTQRYEAAKTDEAPEVDELARWLNARIPKESGASLVHNDYKLDNLVLDGDDPVRVVGVLDWEMSTIGDPLMDLGTALAYWVEARDAEELRRIAFGPTMIEGAMTRRELAARYAEKSGRDVSNALYYYAFGLFKTAAVLQQIFFRYHRGLTRDPRFGALGESARILARAGLEAIEADSI